MAAVADLVTAVKDGGELPTVALEHVAGGTGRLTVDRADLPLGGPGPGVASVRPGDVLFGKLRPYLAKTWLVDREMYASTELMCLRPKDHVEPRLLAYLVASRPLIEWSVATAEGTKMPRTSWGKLREFRLDLPPRAEQAAIADFLDTETARIDALITKKRRLIELLDEAVASTAAEAITGVAGAARTINLGQVLERIIDYRGATPEKTDAGVPLLTASNLIDHKVDLDVSRQYVSEGVYVEWMRRGFPAEGDLLLTTEAPLGIVAVMPPTKVALAQRLVLLRPNTDLVSTAFLHRYLSSPQGQAELLSRASGSTVMGIRTDRLRGLPVPVPEQEEQDAVVAAVDRADQTRTLLSLVLARQLDLLVEHRHGLITAAVTGELPVGVAA